MTKHESKAHRKAMETELNRAIQDGRLRFGLPMWFMPEWRGNLLSHWQDGGGALTEYSQAFGSVEGNTTFYGLPDAVRVNAWLQAVPDSFRFCFKLPRDITHEQNLIDGLQRHWRAWRAFSDQLGQALGQIFIQLPASFGPERLAELLGLLDRLQEAESASLCVELRHPAFFDKAIHEQTLLRVLADRSVSRVTFDSRGLFSDRSQTAEVLEAQCKKPRMPVHPVATGNSPVVRFIGHSQWGENEVYLEQWRTKLLQWLGEGRTPYVFLHTAGNQDVQHFVRFVERLWQVEPLPWPGEESTGRSGELF